jgi:hypothetical protein
VDDTGTLDLASLPTDPARWLPLQSENLNLGYETRPVWLKWQMRREDGASQQWYLEFQ